MAQVIHTGDGDVSNTDNLGYSFTFPALSESEVQVSVNNDGKTVNVDYTIHNFTQAGNSNAYILFLSTEARDSGNVRIFRQTDGNSLEHTFQAGSAIKADDLNKSNQQALYLAEEAREAVNNLALGDSGSAIQISGSNIENNSITTDKILNLEVKTADLDNQSVTTAKIKDSTGTTDGVTTAKIANLNVTTGKIADDAVTADKLADTTVTAGDYTTADISVDAQGRITAAASGTISTSEIENNAVDGTKIAMGSDADGDILYYNGTDYTRLPKGTEGQILSINSSGQPAWIDPFPKAYHTNVTDISSITLTNKQTWYDTPLTVTVPVSATSTKFLISAQLVGEHNFGNGSYPFACRIKVTHTASNGTVTDLNYLVGADDADNTGEARTPITVPMNALWEKAQNTTTEESFTIPAVVHTPNVNNGNVTYLMQIWDNNAENDSAAYVFYVNRTVNDRSGNLNNKTYFERSLSYITAVPVT